MGLSYLAGTAGLQELKVGMHVLLNRLGVDLLRYDGRMFPGPRRMDVMRMVGVNLALDVGANVGQYGRALRNHGYRGRIVSFEPLRGAYDRLAAAAETDPLWDVVKAAVGAESGVSVIHRSLDPVSSSLLPMTGAQVAARPETAYVADEETDVVTLDSYGFSGRILLKVDAEGYTDQVLAGAVDTLGFSVLIELELSLVALWEGQTLLPATVQRIYDAGFYLAGLTPSFGNPTTYEILHCDGLFVRREAVPGRPRG